MKYRTLGDGKPPLPDRSEVDPCWVCMEPTTHDKWNPEVCDDCQKVIVAQLAEALPLLQRHLYEQHHAEAEAFVAAGTLDGAVWKFGSDWVDEGDYSPTDDLVETVAGAISGAIAEDYWRDDGVCISLTTRATDGRLYCGGYRPYVSQYGGCDIGEALEEALRPKVRAWLAATVPGLIGDLPLSCVSRDLLGHAVLRGLTGDADDKLDTALEALEVAHGCGLSDGAFALLRLNAHTLSGDFEVWTNPFGMDDDPEAEWYEVAEDLPQPARGYLGRAREWNDKRRES